MKDESKRSKQVIINYWLAIFTIPTFIFLIFPVIVSLIALIIRRAKGFVINNRQDYINVSHNVSMFRNLWLSAFLFYFIAMISNNVVLSFSIVIPMQIIITIVNMNRYYENKKAL